MVCTIGPSIFVLSSHPTSYMKIVCCTLFIIKYETSQERHRTLPKCQSSHGGDVDSKLAQGFYTWPALQESNPRPLDLGSNTLTTWQRTPQHKEQEHYFSQHPTHLCWTAVVVISVVTEWWRRWRFRVVYMLPGPVLWGHSAAPWIPCCSVPHRYLWSQYQRWPTEQPDDDNTSIVREIYVVVVVVE